MTKRITGISTTAILLVVQQLVCQSAMGRQISMNTPTQRTPHQEMLDGVKSAVFQLRVRTEAGEVFASGTGFLVDSAGTAVTNFHVIQGATSAVAVFEGRQDEFPVELLVASPKFDLAIVKVTTTHKLLWISISDQEPTPGEDVWAMGYPEFGYTVTKGIVSGLREISQLAERPRKVLAKYDPGSRWIQTDCTINKGNSGGPLVNSQGQVWGINTWTWLVGDNQYFALSGVHVRDLLAAIPAKPMTFAQATKVYGTAESPVGAFPHIQIKQTVRSTDLQAAVRNFASQAPCRICKGVGSVSRTAQSGWQSHGTGWSTPVYETSTSECSHCRGRRFNEPAKVIAAGNKLTRAIASLDPTDSKADRVREYARSVIGEVMAHDPEALEVTLASSAKTSFSADSLKPGSQVLFVGKLVEDRRMPGDGSRIRIARVGQSKMNVVLVDMDLVDAVENEPVLIGAYVAGHLDNIYDEVWPVLQRGFVVAGRKATQ